MRIIVVGCGNIGMTIIESLIAEGHDVVAVDEIPEVIASITNAYDIMGVSGNGVDCETLEEAEVAKTELFISVTGSDEFNMLSCFLAKRMGAKHTIARIRNPEYNDHSLGFLRNQLDLSLSINPEFLAAKELLNGLKFPSAVKTETFSNGTFEMVELRLTEDSPLEGMKLFELRKRYQAKFLVCAVQRGDTVTIPDGNFELHSGDRIGLTAAPSEIQKLLKMLGILQKQVKNVMILGASRTAHYLAKLLTANGIGVKVVEKDREECKEFCSNIPSAVVICGDCAEPELLLEEGLPSMDAFVALTGSDEENILLSFFATAQNVPKVISMVNRSELSSMAEKLGLDSIVSPQKMISNVLTRYARALENSLGSNVETLYKIMDGKAEALEFNVQNDFSHLGIPLKEMKRKKNILLAGIIRGRKTIIPSGDDVILAGDRVIVISTEHRLQDLSDIIA